jgi:uncharacterized RDD family membrane protein YckC
MIDIAAVVFAVRYVIATPIVVEPAWINTAAAIAIPLLYEPFLTAYVFTIGQAVMGTRVRHFETMQRITLQKAYLRFVMKYFASIIGTAASQGRVRVWPYDDLRAIHDMQADTVVVNADSAR